MDNKPQENFCRCTRMILFIRQNSPQTGDVRRVLIWTSIYGKRILNRQNYNILAGEGDILRILKEIDKVENRESIGTGIQKLLEDIGNYGNADRTYLFEMVHTPEIFTNTYEWCADGITAQRDNLQDVKFEE